VGRTGEGSSAVGTRHAGGSETRLRQTARRVARGSNRRRSPSGWPRWLTARPNRPAALCATCRARPPAGVGAVVCERCGAPLPPGLRAGARYCSKRCRQAASRARLRDRPCFPPPTPVEVCAWCGEAMLAGLRAEAIFCSKRCRQASSRHTLRSRQPPEGASAAGKDGRTAKA